MLFSELVQKMRNNLALTQIELSELIGVHQTLISFYERGAKSPGMKMLRKFVKEANEKAGMNIKYSDIEIKKEPHERPK